MPTRAAALAIATQRAAARSANGDKNAARTVVKRKVREQKQRVLGIKQMALPTEKFGGIVAAGLGNPITAGPGDPSQGTIFFAQRSEATLSVCLAPTPIGASFCARI